MKTEELNKLFKVFIKHVDPKKEETTNCLLISHILHDVFNKLNIKSEICMGYAAWAIGTGMNDILSHVPAVAVTQTTELNGLLLP